MQSMLLVQYVVTAMFDLWVESRPGKEGLRSVLTIRGELSVMIPGATMMQVSCVHN